MHKSIWIILSIIPFFLFSYASAQQKQTKSENAEFYGSRGLAYLEKRQYEKAISDFNKALKINPADADAYHNRGRAYGEQSQYDLAISDYTNALGINPRHGETYYARGYTYYCKKEYEKSWVDVEKAERLGYSIHPKFMDDLLGASGKQGRRRSKTPFSS